MCTARAAVLQRPALLTCSAARLACTGRRLPGSWCSSLLPVSCRLLIHLACTGCGIALVGAGADAVLPGPRARSVPGRCCNARWELQQQHKKLVLGNLVAWWVHILWICSTGSGARRGGHACTGIVQAVTRRRHHQQLASQA